MRLHTLDSQDTTLAPSPPQQRVIPPRVLTASRLRKSRHRTDDSAFAWSTPDWPLILSSLKSQLQCYSIHFSLNFNFLMTCYVEAIDESKMNQIYFLASREAELLVDNWSGWHDVKTSSWWGTCLPRAPNPVQCPTAFKPSRSPAPCSHTYQYF